MKNMEEKCLQCEGVLFKKIRDPRTGHTALEAEASIKLASDRFTPFLRSPFFGTKNAVAHIKTPSCVTEVNISHLIHPQ
jgi:hypothetical protein